MAPTTTQPEANVWIETDLAALVANYRQICAQVFPARVSAVVKADAYGLGALAVAQTLAMVGCSDFFVADLAEARRLRDGLPVPARLYVLGGLAPGQAAAFHALGALPVLNSFGQILEWRDFAASLGMRLPAAIQIDSGMSRLGLAPAEVRRLADHPEIWDSVDPAVVMSHLACADEAGHAANDEQLARFSALADGLPATSRGLANSSGAFLAEGYRAGLVRAGLGLYGGDLGRHAPMMRSVVTVRARVLQVREISDGAGVGYGLTHVALGERRLATVGIGYADGWPRILSGGAGALYAGEQRLPVVGRISMDSTIVDITGLAEPLVREGDWLEVVGGRQSLEDVARAARTISYEVLTQLSRRAHRTYKTNITALEQIAPPKGVICA